MNNTYWNNFSVTRKQREEKNGHKSFLIWFTGLSGSGKSTLANALEERLFILKRKTYLLDGDNIRHGINKDLNFNKKDRIENIRRIGEISKLFVDSGTIVLSAFISPFKKDRTMVKGLFNDNEFIEVFVDTPLDICEKRDVKGLYAKVRKGEITNFTGIDAPYECPENPDICIKTHKYSIDESVDIIIAFMKRKQLI